MHQLNVYEVLTFLIFFISFKFNSAIIWPEVALFLYMSLFYTNVALFDPSCTRTHHTGQHDFSLIWHKGCSRIKCVGGSGGTYFSPPPPTKKNSERPPITNKINCNLKTTTHKIQFQYQFIGYPYAMLNLLFSLVTNSASSFCGTLEYILLSI